MKIESGQIWKGVNLTREVLGVKNGYVEYLLYTDPKEKNKAHTRCRPHHFDKYLHDDNAKLMDKRYYIKQFFNQLLNGD